MSNSKINRIFKKNIAAVILMIFIAIMLSVSIYLPISTSTLNNHLITVERQKNNNTVTSLTYTLNEIASVAHYFGTLNIHGISDNTTYIDYIKRNNILQQIESSLIVVDSIETLTLERGSVRVGSKMSTFKDKSVLDPEVINKKFYGYFKNVGIYDVSNCGYQYDLYMKISAQSQSSIYNNIYIGVDSMKFADTIFSNSSKNRQELLIDDTGRIIVASVGSNINHTINEIYDYDLLSDDITAEKCLITKINGNKSIITINKMSGLDLYVVNIVDMREYSDYINKNVIYEVVFGCVLFVSISLIAILVFKFTYKPIKQIINNMSGYQITVPDGNPDEIQYINSKFNSLVSENKELTETMNSKIRELRIQQVMALQTQVCPHFMYNTLDALNWIAYREFEKYDNPISNALTNTADLLELSLDLSTVFRSIYDEVRTTKTYIEVLNIRYENSFTFNWNVDESLLECIILKICIQPLIENTVVHAFDDFSDNPQINISILPIDDKIEVAVSDNGKGIEDEFLRELQKNINDFSAISKKHLGLKNVNHRLKLLYGEDYGLSIESERNMGTRCSFLIPQDNQNTIKPIK